MISADLCLTRDAICSGEPGVHGLRPDSRRFKALLGAMFERRRRELRSDPSALAAALGYEVRPFHTEWLEFEANSRRSLLLAPRGHGKSSIAAIVFAIWKVVTNPDVRILLVSNTHDQAKVFLREIRTHLERNPCFRAVFGDLRAGKWSDTELLVRRDLIAKEATVTATGANGLVVGRHFDVIIADDIVDEENSWSETQRSKLHTWFYKTLFPCLEPDGELHVIGTRYHGGDLYGQILARAANRAPGPQCAPPDEDAEAALPISPWAIREDRAVDADSVLWPERFSAGHLAEIRAELGEVIFACQYLNDPSGADDAIFKEDWLQYYETLPMEPMGPDDGSYRTVPLRVYQGVDLAISQRESADYFAMVTIGVDGSHNIYVLDTFRGRLTFEKQLQKIREVAGRFRPLRIAVESNAYQDALPSELIRTAGLPVRKVRQTRDKMVRAIRLSPQFENGKVFLKRSMIELIAELQLFPRAAHDDLFDALEIAVNESISAATLGVGKY